MGLPKIAALYKGSVPKESKFAESLQKFFGVFEPIWLEADDKTVLDLSDFDALVMRPTWGGDLRNSCYDLTSFRGSWNPKFQVATLSASRSKIDLSETINVILAKYGNLDSTAELAIWMAITLRRKLHLHCMSLAQGGWKNTNISTGLGLKGTKWAIIGIGDLGSRVLARLPGLGVSQVKAFYDDEDQLNEKSEKFIAKAFPNWESKLAEGESQKTAEKFATMVEGNPGFDRNGKSIATKQQVNIEVSNKLENVIEDADVVCLTLPLTKTGHRPTEGLIKREHLVGLQNNAVFINISRAEIVSKEAYKSLFDYSGGFRPKMVLMFDKRGFGSDVLAEGYEKELYVEDDYETHRIRLAFSSSMRDPALLPIIASSELNDRGMRFYADAAVELPNVLLTPHVGGSTLESEEAVAVEVIGSLMEELGIREKYEVFYKKGKNLPDQREVAILNEPSQNPQRIVLDDDEKTMCIELSERGYAVLIPLNVWKKSLMFFATVILPIYKDEDKWIILRKSDGSSVLLCDWKFEFVENENQQTIPKFSVDEKIVVDGAEVPLKMNFEEEKEELRKLLAYTLNGCPIALSDCIRFALRILHTITIRCEDRGKHEAEWGLYTANGSLDNITEINWKEYVDAPEPGSTEPVVPT